MSEITFRSDMGVTLIDKMGSDETVARAARVSTGKDQLEQGKIERLIKYLWKNAHTSPFEHCVLTFRAEVPIFVAREWMRHRTQSYNEVSGRYSKLSPVFYIPEFKRPLENLGSGAHPRFEENDNVIDYSLAAGIQKQVIENSWAQYDKLVGVGIATEVARNVLPVSIYTSFYATANLNNWFKFLRLRDGEEGAPQWEIVQAAKKVASIIQEHYPLSYAAFEATRPER